MKRPKPIICSDSHSSVSVECITLLKPHLVSENAQYFLNDHISFSFFFQKIGAWLIMETSEHSSVGKHTHTQ